MDDELWTMDDVVSALGWASVDEVSRAVSRWVVSGSVHHAGTSPAGCSQYYPDEIRAANERDQNSTPRFRVARRAI